MAKTIEYAEREDGTLSLLKEDAGLKKICLLQISGQTDLEAAGQLGIQLETFNIVSKRKGKEEVRQVKGLRGKAREDLRARKLLINKTAYLAVVARGEGGKRRSQNQIVDRRDVYFV